MHNEFNKHKWGQMQNEVAQVVNAQDKIENDKSNELFESDVECCFNEIKEIYNERDLEPALKKKISRYSAEIIPDVIKRIELEYKEYQFILSDNLDCFNELYPGQICDMLIDSGNGLKIFERPLNDFNEREELSEYFKKNKLDIVSAKKLISKGGKLKDAVLENLDLFYGLDQSIIDTFSSSYLFYYPIARNLDSFSDIDYYQFAVTIIMHNDVLFFENFSKFKDKGLGEAEIAKIFFRFEKFSSIASHLELFPNVDQQVLVDKLKSQNKWSAIGDYIEKFDKISSDKVAQEMLDVPGAHDALARNLKKFKETDAEIVQKRIIDTKSGALILSENMSQFDILDGRIIFSIIDRAKNEGSRVFDDLRDNIRKFSNLSIQIAYALNNVGLKDIVSWHIDCFDSDAHREIVDNIIIPTPGNYLEYFLENPKKYSGIEREYFLEIARRHKSSFLLLKNLNVLGFSEDVIKSIISESLSSENTFGLTETKIFSTISLANNVLKNPDHAIVFVTDVFGDFCTRTLYKLCVDLLNGHIDKAFASLGVRSIGKEGFRELREGFSAFKSEILRDNFDVSILTDNLLAQSFFKSYVRYEDSDWGDKSDATFTSTLQDYDEYRKSKKYRGLDAMFVPSGLIPIHRIDKERQKQFLWSEQFTNKYGQYCLEVQQAIRLIKSESKPLSNMFNDIEQLRILRISELVNKKIDIENPKALENINRRINNLSFMEIRSLSDFEDNFIQLASEGGFEPLLRKTMFAYAVHKNKSYIERRGLLRITEEDPSVDNVNSLIDFIDHIVNQETFSEYFTKSTARKKFIELVNISALTEELARAQNQPLKDIMNLEFVPTRGILAEFSGHIADACWAENKKILSAYPNISAVVFLKDRGLKTERIAGATMLIETESINGEPLLVIRGLNPIENIINELSVEDFYSKFTEYVGKIADMSGRKPCIVINKKISAAGSSDTNRPVMKQYLNQLDLVPIKLKSPNDTTFNGYNIVNNVFSIL